MKRSIPQYYRAEPKTLRGAPHAKVWCEAGSSRGAGARSSVGWQTSVGRIARLLHREVARPVGETERALARKKLVDPSDEDREWAEGETVRVFASSLKVFAFMACRFRLAGSQYERRRSRANARLTFTGRAKQKSFDS